MRRASTVSAARIKNGGKKITLFAGFRMLLRNGSAEENPDNVRFEVVSFFERASRRRAFSGTGN
jgi:hypothetical protein